MTVRRGVAPGYEVLELTLDVGEQATRAKAEQVRLEPPIDPKALPISEAGKERAA